MNNNFSDASMVINTAPGSIQTWNDGQLVQVEFQEPATVGGGKAKTPSKVKSKANSAQSTKDYIKRRNRNNIAVKKSREKSKQKGATTLENIEKLKEENVLLEEKVEVLSKELTVLKKVFMDHAKGFGGGNAELPDMKQLEELLGHKLTEKASESPCSSDAV